MYTLSSDDSSWFQSKPKNLGRNSGIRIFHFTLTREGIFKETNIVKNIQKQLLCLEISNSFLPPSSKGLSSGQDGRRVLSVCFYNFYLNTPYHTLLLRSPRISLPQLSLKNSSNNQKCPSVLPWRILHLIPEPIITLSMGLRSFEWAYMFLCLLLTNETNGTIAHF